MELLVQKLESYLDPNIVEIKSPDFLPDIDSGNDREVDVSVRVRAGLTEILVIFECRDRGRTQGVEWIEQLDSKRRSVRAHKIVAVSRNGFTQPSVQKAQNLNIDLRILSDIGPDLFKSLLTRVAMDPGLSSMQTQRTSLVWHALALSTIALALHFAWENAQCSIFYVHGSFEATQWGMLKASMGDVAITWVLYGLVALVSRKWRWTPLVWTSGQWLVLMLAALLVSAGIEVHALATGRWNYMPMTPLVPGLGISAIAVLQLVLLTPITFWIADRLSSGPATQTETEIVQHRYDRIAPVYDLMESLMEFRFRRWRRDLWRLVGDGQVLEVGMGTGKNLRFWPRTEGVLGTDISERMLDRASRKAKRMGLEATLEIADVQSLPYEDDCFDVVICTFLFCSVPDPVLGLSEVLRVLKPGGRVLLVEHVMSANPVLRLLLRLLDPISYHIWGAHLNRDTVDNTRKAGFDNVAATKLWFDVVMRIEAIKSIGEEELSGSNAASATDS